jgi:hypothetical protein
MSTPPGGAAPAGETVRILEIAGALLADEAVWDRSSIRTDDPVDGRYTLYSALATACHEVTGRYFHRHPALEAVRAEIGIEFRDDDGSIAWPSSMRRPASRMSRQY